MTNSVHIFLFLPFSGFSAVLSLQGVTPIAASCQGDVVSYQLFCLKLDLLPKFSDTYDKRGRKFKFVIFG